MPIADIIKAICHSIKQPEKHIAGSHIRLKQDIAEIKDIITNDSDSGRHTASRLVHDLRRDGHRQRTCREDRPIIKQGGVYISGLVHQKGIDKNSRNPRKYQEKRMYQQKQIVIMAEHRSPENALYFPFDTAFPFYRLFSHIFNLT